MRWLLGWVAATALSAAVGLSWAGWLSRMALRSMGQIQTPIIVLFLAVGFASLGASQAFCLRRLIHNPWSWIPATVVGLGLDGLICSWLGSSGGTGRSGARPFLLLAALLVFLVFPGLPQWRVLQKGVRNAWAWVPVNALALLLIVPAVIVFQRIPTAVVTALPPFIVREPLALAIGSLPYALVQGLGLVVLSRRSGQETRVA
jgi:hypothetical protein